MIKGFNSFVKESVENKGKGIGGSQDLFPSAPKKQTINGSNPTMDFLRIGKHIFTNKIDGFIDSVRNESIFITDRISGEIKKYSLSEVLRELTQKKGGEPGSSTVQGFEGTPAWATKQKIYETFGPQREREFEPDPDELETEQEQELEYGDEEEPDELEYGDEEEAGGDGGDMNPDLDDAPASRLSPTQQVNRLNISNAEKMKLLHGTEDNPEGKPNGGNSRNMPNESWKQYWNSYDKNQLDLLNEDLEEEDEQEDEVPLIRGTEDNPIPASGRKIKIESYE